MTCCPLHADTCGDADLCCVDCPSLRADDPKSYAKLLANALADVALLVLFASGSRERANRHGASATAFLGQPNNRRLRRVPRLLLILPRPQLAAARSRT